jgi:hypothetical protein
MKTSPPAPPSRFFAVSRCPGHRRPETFALLTTRDEDLEWDRATAETATLPVIRPGADLARMPPFLTTFNGWTGARASAAKASNSWSRRSCGGGAIGAERSVA